MTPVPAIAILEAAKPSRGAKIMADDAVNQIERLLNNFGAELTVQRAILQVMIS
jgi:hypothetical protein